LLAGPPLPAEPALILGAGLAGLSASVHLRRAGVPHRVFERGAAVGGHAVTVEEGGYRFDRTGHLLHLRDEQMRRLVVGLLGDKLQQIQRKSRIFSHGVYTRYPFQANTFGLPPEVAYRCLTGFFEARARPPARPPENFEEFCLAHFGEGFSREFMIPYNEKLWGVSLREITAAWCQRFVPVPRVEDVLAGAVGLNDRELGYNASFLYPRGGIGELPRALAHEAGPIELNRAPRSIDEQRRVVVFDDGEVGYERLISTIPLDALGGLLTCAPPAVRQAFSRLRCAPLRYLDVALRAPLLRDLHWVYVPGARYPFYRVGSYSNLSPDLAPPGCASLYIELTDRGPPDLATLGPEVARGLVEMGLIASEGDVLFTKPRHLTHAYVIFDHHYFEALAAIRPYLEGCGIASTGRYGGWNYSSMEDALLFGRDAASTLTAPP